MRGLFEGKMNPCCCVSLRTGGMIIGVAEIILYALGLIMYGSTVIAMSLAHSINSTAVEQALNETNLGSADPIFRDSKFEGLLILCVLMTVVCMMQLVVAAVLVVGIKKESLNMLKIWMGVKVLAIMLSVVMLLVSIMKREYADLGSVVTDLFTIFIGIYSVVVVYALAQEYKKGGNGSLATLHRKT